MFRAVSVFLELGRLAVLERWLNYTVTTLDRFYCTPIE